MQGRDASRDRAGALHLGAIVKVAGALRGKVPGTGAFKMPAAGLASETLLHAADAVRTTAAIYKDVFVEHGLPADFLEQLDGAGSALKASVDARGVAQSRRVGASTGLTEDLALGRQIVTMIDASLTHALKSDSSTLASWRQAKRATVKGVVSRAGVGGAPIVVGGGSPVVGGGSPVVGGGSPVVGNGSVASGAVPAVASGGSVSKSVVPAAHSHVPADVPQGSMAA